MKQLNLIIPGLLGPFSNQAPQHIQQQLKQPEFTQLNRYLSRANLTKHNIELKSGEIRPVDSYYQTLVELINPQCKLSLCKLTAEYDAVDISEGNFYRADPVHFKAESDHAILLAPDIVLPTQSEAEQLIESFNQHFCEDRISLHLGHKNRWYLQTEKPLKLTFTPLDYALGRDIKHFMPRDVAEGSDALWWRKILNEAQMLFFQHPLNQQREANAKLTINGLWLWDALVEPSLGQDAKVKHVFTHDVVASSLASQAAIAVHPVDAFSGVESASVLVINSLYESVCYGDMDAWLEALQTFSLTQFQLIVGLLAKRKIDEINLYPCNGELYKINRFSKMKFWKSAEIISSKLSGQ